MKMPEDYLWDKTGRDPEIEELENLLGSFRLRDTSPPALPVRSGAGDTVRFRLSGYFLPALAGLTGLLLLAFATGLYRTAAPDRRQTAAADTRAEAGTNVAELGREVPPVREAGTEPAPARRPPRRKTVRPPKRKTPVRRRNLSDGDRPRPALASAGRKKTAPPERGDAVSLTKEEKDAYERLIRALAITGEQFRIVREKIRGEDESEAPGGDDGR